eukprot:491360-Pleurochrysis_carterae.AAC.5
MALAAAWRLRPCRLRLALLIAHAAIGAATAATSRVQQQLLSALRKPPSAAALAVRLFQQPGARHRPDAELELLSDRLRRAGADALLFCGSQHQLEIIIREQQRAASDFPGPCPVLYEPSNVDDTCDAAQSLVDCGAHGVVIPLEQKEKWELQRTNTLPLVPSIQHVEAGGACTSRVNYDLVIVSKVDSGDDNVAEATGPQILLAAMPVVDGTSSARVRKLRERGFAGVLVDFDLDDWPADPEVLLRSLRSKRSSTFGTYGLKMGYGDFMSDQYWLNKTFKEAKAMQKKQGGGGDGEIGIQ